MSSNNVQEADASAVLKKPASENSQRQAGSGAVDVSDSPVAVASPMSDSPTVPAPAPAAMAAPPKNKKQWLGSESDVYEKDLDYMSSAAAAVLQQSPKGGQQLLWAIATFFVVVVVWASLAYVDEFTRGEGKVIPSSQNKIIQNLEGGIVAELYVKSGDKVQAGQKLLRIDDTQFSSELRGSDGTVEKLKAKMARLSAEADGRNLLEDAEQGIGAEAWSEAYKLFVSRYSEQHSRDQILVQQISQKRQELNELKSKRDQHFRSYNLMKRELEYTSPLVKSGAVSQVELLRLERQVNDLRGELSSAELAIPRAKSAMQEAKDKLESSKFAFQSEARKELNEVRLEMQRMEDNSDALEDKVNRTLVISPVAGTIKTVNINTIGGVLQPGMDIVEIVPTEDSLMVEAKIKPSDIAYMHPGQKAIVKVTAYDFAIHGGLAGELVNLSPDTIVDEEGNSFYLVRVKTNKSYLGTDEKPLPIISGMTVSVDVMTGEKTVLDYILKPILKTKQLALRER